MVQPRGLVVTGPFRSAFGGLAHAGRGRRLLPVIVSCAACRIASDGPRGAAVRPS